MDSFAASRSSAVLFFSIRDGVYGVGIDGLESAEDSGCDGDSASLGLRP